MIYYLTTESHTKPISVWLSYFSHLWSGRFKILTYENLNGSLTPGTFIFADYERLNRRLANRARIVHRNAVRAGCPVLNHPTKSLRRYDLQKRLSNAFRVFRSNEIPEDLSFPVFLRKENDHRGSLTPLLHNWLFLGKGLEAHPDSLVVEYVDTSDHRGIYRKYGAMRIGERIVPRHIYYNKSWLVKDTDYDGISRDLVHDEFVKEEMEYVRSTGHRDQLYSLFDLAQVKYGRIDYSFLEGVVQVWEVNSNPALLPFALADEMQRGPIIKFTSQMINDALQLLDAEGADVGQTISCGDDQK